MRSARGQSSNRRWLRALLAMTLMLIAAPLVLASSASAVTYVARVAFEPSTAPVPAGYTADTGVAYAGTQGWTDTSGNPISMTANTRLRAATSATPDSRYNTMMLVQAPSGSGNTTPGRWNTTLANGQYDVTVAVGDVTAINSVDTIVAQGGTANAVTIINGFVPTTAAPFSTVTKRITVTTGKLTLDATGGTNTKLDYVDIAQATADTTPPVVTATPSGSLTAGTTYAGPVTITASATDNVGVTGISYAIDGGASTPYTAPFQVTGIASHSVVVSATDAAGNIGTQTVTFTETAPAAGPTSGHVNFGAQTTAAISGYTLDYGQAFSTSTGFGWETTGSSPGTPLNMVGNGRERNLAASPDKRYDTMMQMQELAGSSSGTLTPGQWEYTLANGTYNVTATVGDASAVNSTNFITAERGTPNAVTIINGFVPTSGNYFQTVTKTVTVSDGRLTLDPVGGTNTKLDYVDIVPAGADTIAPVASIALAGTFRSGSTTVYGGPVTVTASATDNVGVTSLTYSVDNGATQAYTVPFQVTGDATHTVKVTAGDAAGNVGTQSSTFTINSSAPPAPTSGHINFGAQTTAAISGYSLDYGQAFSTTTGYGWETTGSSPGTPLNMVGNGRERNLAASPSKLYDTMMQMQEVAGSSSGTLTPGQWEYALANGTYSVQVAVGDASALNSTDTITAERGTANAVTIINGFVPTSVSPFQTVTKTVTVSDGRLTLDPVGGTNTKLDFVNIVPVADTVAPTATFQLSGLPATGGTATSFAGDVTAAVSATDNPGGSGVNTVTYSLDGAGSLPYTAPVKVTTDGSHSMVVTVTDVAGNVGTYTQTWTELHDVTKPTAVISLAGTQSVGSPSTYTTAVQATVTPADENGGSGVATTSYVLDTAASAPYTGPITVSGNGNHTLTVTVTDNAGNVTTATSTFTIQVPPVDTTPPSSVVTLSGTAVSGSTTSYASDVTVGIVATDNPGGSGVKTVTYTLDGGASTAYTAPFKVTTDSSLHTLVVTATDNAGNSAQTTQTWTEAHDTTAPTASVQLSGLAATGGSATAYAGDVTATITASDNPGGSGVNTVTYNLDNTGSVAYTAPVTFKTDGSHSLSVTVTDNVGLITTTTTTWTELHDVTKPTAVITLAGTQSVGSATTYTSAVQATVAPADENGGSGVASTTYVLDGGASTAYATPITVSTNGNHTLTVTVTDKAGNVGTATSTFTVQIPPADTTPPTSVITLGGTFVSGSTTSYASDVTASVVTTDNPGGSGVASVSYTLDGGASTAYTAPVKVTADGSHTLVVTATDVAGNSANYTQTWTEAHDTTAPSATVSLGGTLIAGSTTTYNGDVTPTITASDNPGGSGVNTVTYNLDNAGSVAYTAPFAVSTNGSHSLSVTVTDNVGLITTTTTTWTELHDTTAPTGLVTVGGTTLTNGVVASDASVTLTGTDETGGSGVKSISYTLDNGSSTPYTAAIPVTADGSHTIVETVTDNAGNVSAPITKTWVENHAAATDTTAPTATVSLSGNQSAGSPTTYTSDVSATVSPTDVGSGVYTVTYTLDTGSATPYTGPIPVTTDGNHTLTVTVTDYAGNVSAPIVTTWTEQHVVDKTAPTVTFTLGGTQSVSSPTTYTSAVQVTVNAADEVGGSGLASTTYSLDGATPATAYTAPFTVSTNGNHTVVVTATDKAGNVGTYTQAFTVQIPQADTVPPTVAATITGGNLVSGTTSTYSSDVTVSVAASDNVGVTSLTYVLDGATIATNYTAPVVVTTDATHTLVATAMDAAGNSSTSTITWTEQHPTSAHVNFGAQTTKAIAGYTLDYGQAFSTTTGSGWETTGTAGGPGTPLNMVGNGRERNLTASGDKLHDTMMQMQEVAGSSSGTLTPGQWETVLANGTYNVTVTVGDASATNSTHFITAERGTPNQTTIINGFVETTNNYFQTVTKKVVVSDGRLTLDPVGGTNTKIDYVDVTQADVTPPTIGITLSGSQDVNGNYTSTVKATVNAADETGGSGLASTTYTLDGITPAAAYTAPVLVTSQGSHTLVVTATDNAGNVTTVTKTWTENPDTIAPTASISLGGNTNSTGTYTSDVTATVTAADTGGSGLASTTYVLDGGQPQPYTTPIVVQSDTTHTLTVTVTDAAGNTFTTPATTWTEAHLDTTPPTIVVGLGGTTNPSGVYTSGVTATVTVTDTQSGVNTVTYNLDNAGSVAYTQPIVVSTPGSHTLTVTATDKAGNIAPVSTTTWNQAVDSTPPTVSVSSSGQKNGNGVYNDVVTVTANVADEVGGSGLATTTYTLDGGAVTPYTGPVTVSGDGTHTVAVTGTDYAGNSASGSTTFTISTAALVTSGHVDFGTQTSTPYTGYTLDYGQPFTTSAGFGWLDNSSGAPPVTPATLVGNGRQRNSSLSTDARYDHFIQMQQTSTASGGVLTQGAWEYAIANGTYNVTVGVGDATATNSVNNIVAQRGTPQAVTIINKFVPTSSTLFQTKTVAVTVTNGQLILDPTGGTNTKIDFVDINATTDVTPPTAAVTVTGPTNGTIYYGSVSITGTAADELGGSGLNTVTYSLDGSAPAAYTAGQAITVTANGTHTFTLVAKDNAGNTRTVIKNFNLQYDTVAPTVAIGLAGTQDANGNYGTVVVTLTGTDNQGGSGIGSLSYTLDGAATPTVYTGPFSIYSDQTHTLVATATDNAGNASAPQSTTWKELHTGPPAVTVTAPDSTLLGLSTARLVFSATNGQPLPAARSFTFTNTGQGTLNIANIAISGTDAASFSLVKGQPTSYSIPVNSSVTISVNFTPTLPTNCPTDASPYLIGNDNRDAVLTFTSNDASNPTGSANLSGESACYAGGNGEPLLDQMIHAWGYTDVVNAPNSDRRYIGPLRYLPSTDEIQSPYFTVADPTQPVTFAPLAHYSGSESVPYHQGGYYLKSNLPVNSACSAATCKQSWIFPGDILNSDGSWSFTQQQTLMPVPTGSTTMNPPAGQAFGIYLGDQGDTTYSDDSLNVARTASGPVISPLHLLHSMRIFPAYGPNHVLIPNTYLVTNDITREPADKNNDFQDIVAILKNVTPALTPAASPGAASLNRDLTTGVTVGANCAVTGFDGVLANNAGTQCNTANLAATPTGLAITSSAGQLATGDQQNALYNNFDASKGAFTIRARIVGGLNTITQNYHQFGVFFGPDTNNFLKIEIEHNGGTDPGLAMFYDDKGVASTIANTAVPGLASATSLDLIIKGNTQALDATPTTNDPNVTHGYPLDQLTVWYSVNGAAPVQIGTTIASPEDVSSWFSVQAKAGILVSNSGNTTPVTGTFSQFQISNG